MENLTRYLQTNAKTSRQPFSLFGISAVHPQHAQHGGFFGDGMGSAPGSTFSYLKARNFFLPKA